MESFIIISVIIPNLYAQNKSKSMKPLNSSERTNAIWKFSLFYAVTVIFAVLGFVFLLYVPDNALKAENTNLNHAVNEQKKLVMLIDSMGRQLKGLETLDASFNQMTNEFDQAQSITTDK